MSCITRQVDYMYRNIHSVYEFLCIFRAVLTFSRALGTKFNMKSLRCHWTVKLSYSLFQSKVGINKWSGTVTALFIDTIQYDYIPIKYIFHNSKIALIILNYKGFFLTLLFEKLIIMSSKRNFSNILLSIDKRDSDERRSCDIVVRS